MVTKNNLRCGYKNVFKILHKAEDRVTNINTRSVLFWGITQRIVVINYRLF